MSPAGIKKCAVAGGLTVAAALVGLCVTFQIILFPMASHPDLDLRLRQFGKEVAYAPPLLMWFLGTALMFAGVFLCVKARLAPPHFWTHTGRHLLYTAGVAGVLSFLPFAVVVLAPR